jgi:hypothetical protein
LKVNFTRAAGRILSRMFGTSGDARTTPVERGWVLSALGESAAMHDGVQGEHIARTPFRLNARARTGAKTL